MRFLSQHWSSSWMTSWYKHCLKHEMNYSKLMRRRSSPGERKKTLCSAFSFFWFLCGRIAQEKCHMETNLEEVNLKYSICLVHGHDLSKLKFFFHFKGTIRSYQVKKNNNIHMRMEVHIMIRSHYPKVGCSAAERRVFNQFCPAAARPPSGGRPGTARF